MTVESLAEPYFEIEGERIEISPNVMGDTKYNAMVWIPSIKTLYVSDVLSNQAHPFTSDLNAEERREWIKGIDNIEKMGAEAIIPGHQKPGMQFDKSSLDFTREYLLTTEEEIARTISKEEFFYAMNQRFPQANLFYFAEMNARVLKEAFDWNWREI